MYKHDRITLTDYLITDPMSTNLDILYSGFAHECPLKVDKDGYTKYPHIIINIAELKIMQAGQ